MTIKHNIIVLDWSYYNGYGKIEDPTDYPAIGRIYISAAANVSAVGETLAEMLKKLPTENFHLIGHSLGGHLSKVINFIFEYFTTVNEFLLVLVFLNEIKWLIFLHADLFLMFSLNLFLLLIFLKFLHVFLILPT